MTASAQRRKHLGEAGTNEYAVPATYSLATIRSIPRASRDLPARMVDLASLGAGVARPRPRQRYGIRRPGSAHLDRCGAAADGDLVLATVHRHRGCAGQDGADHALLLS